MPFKYFMVTALLYYQYEINTIYKSGTKPITSHRLSYLTVTNTTRRVVVWVCVCVCTFTHQEIKAERRLAR